MRIGAIRGRDWISMAMTISPRGYVYFHVYGEDFDPNAFQAGLDLQHQGEVRSFRRRPDGMSERVDSFWNSEQRPIQPGEHAEDA